MILTVDPASIGFSASLCDYLVAVSTAGFQAAEFSIERAITEWGNDPGQLMLFAKRCNVILAQFTCGLGIPSNLCISAQAFMQGLQGWREACAFASKLGCHRASVLAHGSKGSTLDPQGTPLDAEELQRRLYLICTIAQEYSITVAIELIDPILFHNAKNLIEEVRKSGTTNIGLLLDTYGLHATADPLAYTTTLLDYVSWVHIADTQLALPMASGKPIRVLPGYGQLPLQALLGMLQDHGYAGNVSVEVYADHIFTEATHKQRAEFAANSLLENASLRSFFACEDK